MRENYAGKIAATCLAIFAVLVLIFAYSSDASGASDFGALRSSLGPEIVSESTGARETADPADLSDEPLADFDPFALPLVLPEIEDPIFDITNGIVAARWAEHVTVTRSDSEFRFQSNGIPNHELPNPFLAVPGRSYSPASIWSELTDLDRTVRVAASPIDQTITLAPVLAETPNDAPAGLIGVLINGAQLYNDGDPVNGFERGFFEPGFVDLCNGHPIGVEGNAARAGAYHYHAVPSCTTDAIDVEGQHSSILGVLIDGFPVYGSNDVGGAAIQRRDLDECSGHFGPTPEFPNGVYHYHLLDEVSPNPISCLSGEIDNVDTAVDVDVTVDVDVDVKVDDDVVAAIDTETDFNPRGLGR